MTVEILKPCCSELSCSRQQPVRVQYQPETGTWWVITAYAELGHGGIGEVRQRHQLHPDDAAYLNALLVREGS